MGITATNLAAARRAIDEKAIRERGALAAVMVAKTEDTACRRASMILGHVPDSQVVAALGVWLMLNERAS